MIILKIKIKLKSDEFAKDADEDEDDEEEVVDRPPYFEDEECVCRNLNENGIYYKVHSLWGLVDWGNYHNHVFCIFITI